MISIESAERFCKDEKMKQVILVGWDGRQTHVATYGINHEHCAQAAQGGDKIKTAIGWPASYQIDPPIVGQLKAKIRKLEAQLVKLNKE